jgi:hypothetical protein
MEVFGAYRMQAIAVPAALDRGHPTVADLARPIIRIWNRTL